MVRSATRVGKINPKLPMTQERARAGHERLDGDHLGSKGKGYRTVAFEGFEILIGKADADNDRLTFGIAEPRDFWLHVAGPAGSHVVVRNRFGLEELPRPVLVRAAELAAWHSKSRGARGKVEVHVCRVADVRKPKGFAPGQVLLKRWDAVKAYPRGEEPQEGD